MAGLFLDIREFAQLSAATRQEILDVAGLAVAPAPEGAAPWDPEGDEPYPLSLREAKDLIRGLSGTSRTILRLFCQNANGESGRASLDELLQVTGQENARQLGKSMAGVTRRLRTVTKNREAWLFDWLEEEWDAAAQAAVKGHYAIEAPAIQPLCQALGTEGARQPGT